jgi:DNA-binding NtrC family response regulator
MIPSLVTDFLADAAARTGRKAPADDATALARLAKHDWPGNVRELKAVVERAMLLAPGDRIEGKHVMIDTPVADASPAPSTGATHAAPADGDAAERAKIIAALDDCAGNQTRAAKTLGISRATLAHKLALHRIPRPRKP